MKRNLILIIAALGLTIPGLAQITVPGQTGPTVAAVNTFIKGNLNISFDTTQSAKPVNGVTDKYSFDVNVSNSARFHGTIERLPNISAMVYGSQAGLLTYDVALGIYNPRNPHQTADIGKLYGSVPNDKQNVYRFEDGDLKVAIEGHGSAAGFESRFAGLALGKPPTHTSMFGGLKQQVMSITRSVKGQAMTLKVEKYDMMEFHEHILGAGPVQKYPSVAVNGKMLYDYNRGAWHFVNVSCVYATAGGQQHQDSLTGDILWQEDANRKSNGKGKYVFDIRVNEPPPSEDSVFAASSANDESAFFATDNSVPALTGTMDYVDTLKDNPDPKGDPITTASVVQINLVGNQLTQQQIVYLAKLLLFSVTVPLNSD